MKQDPSINDIMGTGGLTRSGRCYALSLSRVKEGDECIKPSGVKVTISKKKREELLNEPVVKTKANAFLKFIKHNEYNIIE